LTEGKKCEHCGQVIVAQVTVPATGHDYDEGVMVEAATCVKDGIRKFTCKNDSTHSYTEVIAATGHLAAEPVKENEKAPTSEEEGSYDLVTYCKRCGAELSRETFKIPVIESPKTGDDSLIFAWCLLLVLSLALMVVVTMLYRKRKMK